MQLVIEDNRVLNSTENYFISERAALLRWQQWPEVGISGEEFAGGSLRDTTISRRILTFVQIGIISR